MVADISNATKMGTFLLRCDKRLRGALRALSRKWRNRGGYYFDFP